MKAKAMIIRIITTGLAMLLVMSVSGCSVIMGIFGPEEAIMNDTSTIEQPARILVPTPTAPSDESATPRSAEPTASTMANLSTQSKQTSARRLITITGNSVNLRSQPGTDAKILHTAPAGSTFEFLDKNSAGDWYQICCIEGETAWVFGELAKLGEAAAAPVETPKLMQTTPTIATADPVDSPSTISESTSTLSDLDIPLEAPIFTQKVVDGGTRYDYSEQGFAITLPDRWQPLDLSADRLADGLRTLTNENAQAAALVQSQLQRYINARYPFFAAELTPAVLNTGFATTVTLLRLPLPAGISLDFYTQIMAKQAQEKYSLTSPVSVIPSSLPAGKSVMLNYTINGATSGAGNQPLVVTQYLVMQGQTVYALTFTTAVEQIELYAATFAAIAESFKLLDK
jgi:SH3-like domain-containing protein